MWISRLASLPCVPVVFEGNQAGGGDPLAVLYKAIEGGGYLHHLRLLILQAFSQGAVLELRMGSFLPQHLAAPL